MSETSERYEYLSGPYWGSLRLERQQLWLGQGRLILLIDRGYVERHKIFHLKDIQALSLAPTFQGSFISILWALAGLAFLGLFLIAWVNEGEEFTSLALVATCAAVAGLAINVALGPTCRCHLYTATQVQRLICLSRTRRARRVLHTLAAHIEAAQSNETPNA